MSIATKNKNQELLDRRKAVVANGVSVFVPSTAVSAKGAVITDADGRELIDFGGGIGVLNAGHCPDPVVKAIKAQADQLLHACFHISTYAPYVELCEKLVDLFPHGEQTKVMLTNTGAESVENAVKIARQATGRQAVIAFTDAFHGRSLMAMTLTSKIGYKIGCGPFAPEVYRLKYPNYYRYGKGMTEDQFAEKELAALEEAALKVVDPKHVAAIIIELVQGEGGFTVAPKKYVQGLRQFCDKYGIMLIIDEVQSGFCRTGKWAAYQHYDITPDISTWAKSMGSGMPIGAVIGKAEVMDKAVVGTIGGTYLGNPVSCAASIATIDYMKSIDLNEKSQELGKKLVNHFKKLQSQCSVIGDVRGIGSMVAMEFVKNGDPNQPDGDLCTEFAAKCLERGLLLVTAGTYRNVVRVLCPIVIEDETLERGLKIMEEELLKLTK